MFEITTILLVITIWACHQGLLKLVDYLLKKIAIIGVISAMIIGTRRIR